MGQACAIIGIGQTKHATKRDDLSIAGLVREAATRIIDGRANRAVAHATSGPCLQQNLVAVLEAR